jgi:ABC-type sugar transport system permease subunit
VRPRARWHPWIMLGPSLAILTIFFVVPVLLAAGQSLFAWDMLTPPRFVGGSEYAAVARRGALLDIALRTLGFSAIVVVGSMVVGLALAVGLNRRGRFFGFVRAAVFSAYVVSWVSVALLWMGLLDPDGGPIAGVLRALHLPRTAWLGDPHLALVTIAAVTVWKVAGYAMILFLAALQSVPPSLLEAAAIDGAGAVARFRYVTWPLLRPTAAFVATTSLVASFQTFDVVRIMTQGGPAKTTTLFVYAIYEEIFLNLSVGRASAVTVVFFVVLAGVAALQLRVFRARERGRA